MLTLNARSLAPIEAAIFTSESETGPAPAFVALTATVWLPNASTEEVTASAKPCNANKAHIVNLVWQMSICREVAIQRGFHKGFTLITHQ